MSNDESTQEIDAASRLNDDLEPSFHRDLLDRRLELEHKFTFRLMLDAHDFGLSILNEALHVDAKRSTALLRWARAF